MATPTIIALEPTTPDLLAKQEVQVYVKPTWTMSWQQIPGLYATSCSFAVNGIGRAELRYEHGNIKRRNAAFQLVAPLTLARWWVKIVVVRTNDGGSNKRTWLGTVVASGNIREGFRASSDYGDQVFICEDFGWALSRYYIRQTEVTNPDNTTFRVDRALPFNRQADSGEWLKNYRLAGASDAFTNVASDGTGYWTIKRIADHLVTNHPAFLQPGPKGTYNFPSATQEVQLDPHGKSMLQILNELFSPQRGWGWWIEYDDNDTPAVTTYTIKAASHAPEAISLPSGASIPANSRQWAVLHDGYKLPTGAVLFENYSNHFDQVVVRGVREGAVYTLTKRDTSDVMEKDWTSSLVTSYLAGAGITGEPSDKEDASSALRASHPLRTVFTHYKVPESWEGRVQSAATGPFPVARSNGAARSGSKLRPYHGGYRLQMELPIKSHLDYTTDPGNPTSVGDVGSYMRGICVAKIDDKYYLGDQLHALAKSDKKGKNGISWAIHMRGYQDGPGLSCEPTGDSHLLAKDDADPATINDTNVVPQSAWQDIRATVYAQCDAYCEAAYPQNPSSTGSVVSRRYIEVGDKFHMDWMPAGTVLGVNPDGTLKVSATSNWIRNDFTRAYDLARMAYDWYAIERQNVRLPIRYFETLIGVGDLITELGFGTPTLPVNTMVTAVEYDLLENSTTIHTSGAEDLDFSGFF